MEDSKKVVIAALARRSQLGMFLPGNLNVKARPALVPRANSCVTMTRASPDTASEFFFRIVATKRTNDKCYNLIDQSSAH